MTDWDQFYGDGCVRHGDEWIQREEAAADAVPGNRGPIVHICILCHNPTEFDDVVISHGPESCVCLRCYSREVDNEKRLSMDLRRQVQQVLKEQERH